MIDLDRDSLHRVLPSPTGSADWDEVLSRSRVHLGRRRRRMVALAVAALVAVGTASAFGAVRDIFRGVGFIGLPPKGATPSAPDNRGATPSAPEGSGELVLFYWGPAAGNSEYGRGGVGKSRIWVYADGRLIFLREADVPEGANPLFTGFLEQRLMPEGAELLRSEAAAASHDQAGSEPVPFGIKLEVREGDQLARVDRVSNLERLKTRLTDPASWLPASAWEDREIRAYLPSRYAVCYGGWPQPIEASRILGQLPGPAEVLLRPRVRTKDVGGFYCSDATTEEARELAEALDDGGLEQGGVGDDRGPARAFRLEYNLEVPGSPGETAQIFFEPYLPHGEWTCSPCG